MVNKTSEIFQRTLRSKESRRRFFIFLIMAVLILYLAGYASPKVSLRTNIYAVTDNDYNLFLKNNDGIASDKKTRDNCRLFSVDFKINKPFIVVRNLEVRKELLNRYLEDKLYFDPSADEFRGLGTYTSTDGMYHFIESLDVYSDGLTDDKLYRFFEDYQIEVSWRDLFNRKHKEYYYLKDYYD